MLQRNFSSVSNQTIRFLAAYLNDNILSKWDVSYDPEVIDSDPTRRYFETHLAYYTFKSCLAELNLDELQQHLDILYSLLSQPNADEARQYFSTKDRTSQFSDHLARINAEPVYANFSLEEKQKLSLLIQCIYIYHSPFKMRT